MEPLGLAIEVEMDSDPQALARATFDVPNGEVELVFDGLVFGGSVFLEVSVAPLADVSSGISPAPTSYRFDNRELEFDSVTVCVPFADNEVASLDGPSQLRLLQITSAELWVDITLVPTELGNGRICGMTDHLSHFALAKWDPLRPPVKQRLGSVAGLWAWNGTPREKLVELGVAWGRATIHWDLVQPSGPDDADFSLYDKIIDRASGSGSRNVHVMVTDNPAWAAASPCTITTEQERAHLGEFMTMLATRYKDLVSTWMLYSEIERVGYCFGTGDADGQPTQEGRDNYALMVEVVGDAIHAADPDAKLSMEGLVSGNFAVPGCLHCSFDGGFLKGVLGRLREDNKLGSLDYVGLHWYSSQGGQDPMQEYPAGDWAAYGGVDLIGRVSKLRRDMIDVGLGVHELKPIVVAEASYTGLNPRAGDRIEEFLVEQRNYVPKVLARATYMDVMALYWFMYWDAPAGTGGGDDNLYGLLDEAGTIRKPSFYAYQQFTASLPGDGGAVTQIDTDDPRLEGYDFSDSACGAGEHLQIVWNQHSDEPLVYVPADGNVVTVADSVGNSVPFDGIAVVLGGEPKYICYFPSP